ncbi:MAG TPA: sigma factor-like helix-turn-helix DNA-binding protein, partial [Acidimicrobiales bacterium]|nr:sigma factor-like helix-turn-helix DNA-binding protein [Acidimicrobiales bacterium]
ARNACMDELRARVRRRQRDACAELEPNGAYSGRADLSADLSAADLLRQLDPERRAAFALTQVIGLSYAEAAQVCGCPIGTVRSRVARARGDLVALLQEPDEAEERRAN